MRSSMFILTVGKISRSIIFWLLKFLLLLITSFAPSLPLLLLMMLVLNEGGKFDPHITSPRKLNFIPFRLMPLLMQKRLWKRHFFPFLTMRYIVEIFPKRNQRMRGRNFFYSSYLSFTLCMRSHMFSYWIIVLPFFFQMTSKGNIP